MLNRIRLFTEGFMTALLICAVAALWYVTRAPAEHGYTENQRERMAVLAEMVSE
jgi:hypothetical protein